MEKINSVMLLLDAGNTGEECRNTIENYCKNNNIILDTLYLKNCMKEDIEDTMKNLVDLNTHKLIVLYFGSEYTRACYGMGMKGARFMKYEEIKDVIKEYFPYAIFKNNF